MEGRQLLLSPVRHTDYTDVCIIHNPNMALVVSGAEVKVTACSGNEMNAHLHHRFESFEANGTVKWLVYTCTEFYVMFGCAEGHCYCLLRTEF